MRKALFWMLLGFILFALLVGIIFGYLSYKENKAKEQLAAEGKSIDALPEYIDKEQKDSLINLINMKDSIIAVSDNKRDSLSSLIQTKNSTIDNYKETIANLRNKIEDKKNREENIKNLAKTYESLRVSEMTPILEDISDRTLIDIYNKMSSRKRMKLLQALPPNRAARLTNKLAS